jgi:uncharacterized protein YjbI with pentapeptide repeats
MSNNGDDCPYPDSLSTFPIIAGDFSIMPEPQYTREQVIEMVRKGESLTGADLSEIDLSGVDFSPKEYGGPCEKPAYLDKADLYKANLNGADLRCAEISKANLKHAYLFDADLSGASLNGANLSCTYLRRAKLQADLSEAELIRADLKEADLSWAKLNGAKLRGANLSKANLVEAKLNGADLRDTDLMSADLENANLTGADITGANIYHIKNHGWKIDKIKCDHYYKCPDDDYWMDPEKRKEYRSKKLAPDEFSKLFAFGFYNIKSIKSASASDTTRKRWARDEEKQKRDNEKKKAKEWLCVELEKGGCSCEHINMINYMVENLADDKGNMLFDLREKDFKEVVKEVFDDFYKGTVVENKFQEVFDDFYKGTVVENKFQDKVLFLNLLKGNVIKKHKNSLDYLVHFDRSIKNEEQLKIRLKQKDIIDIEPILAIWRQSQKDRVMTRNAKGSIKPPNCSVH